MFYEYGIDSIQIGNGFFVARGGETLLFVRFLCHRIFSLSERFNWSPYHNRCSLNFGGCRYVLLEPSSTFSIGFHFT